MLAAFDLTPPKLLPCIGWYIKACHLIVGEAGGNTPPKPTLTQNLITLHWKTQARDHNRGSHCADSNHFTGGTIIWLA